MESKTIDLGSVSESFAILKAYQFEIRKQETDLLVPVNQSTSMSSQLEMAM